MKATTLIFMLVVMGMLFDLGVVPGVSTLGSSILRRILPDDLYAGGTGSWTGLVGLSAGVLSFGVLLLGSKAPYAAFFLFFMAFMTMPVEVLTSGAVGMPATIKAIMGVLWFGMFISAAVNLFRSDA